MDKGQRLPILVPFVAFSFFTGGLHSMELALSGRVCGRKRKRLGFVCGRVDFELVQSGF